jgi:hypothetical protein
MSVDLSEPLDRDGKKSASTLLVDLALKRYEFGVTEEGQPFAVRPGGHVVRMLRGGQNSLRAELSQLFYRMHGKAAPQQALADALLVLEGKRSMATRARCTYGSRLARERSGSILATRPRLWSESTLPGGGSSLLTCRCCFSAPRLPR